MLKRGLVVLGILFSILILFNSFSTENITGKVIQPFPDTTGITCSLKEIDSSQQLPNLNENFNPRFDNLPHHPIDENINLDHVQSTSILCTTYEDIGLSSITVGVIATADLETTRPPECQVELILTEGYYEREMSNPREEWAQEGAEITREYVRSKAIDKMHAILLPLIYGDLYPLFVTPLKIHFATQQELIEAGLGAYTQAAYLRYPRELVLDDRFDIPEAWSFESAIYHELVHAYQIQVLEARYKTEIEEFNSNFNERVDSALINIGFPRRILSIRFPDDFREDLTEEEALAILKQKEGFYSLPEVEFISEHEFVKFEFIPEYRNFFANLDFCRNYIEIDIKEGWLLLVDPEGKTKPKYGAYSPDQCSNIYEYIAYILQITKFYPERVKDAERGEFGYPEKYRENSDLALRHNWITQRDYDRIHS